MAGDELGDIAATGSKAQALTAVQERVFGFETPTADWSSTNGPVSASNTFTQGTKALGVAPGGYTEVRSIVVPVPTGSIGPLSFDLRLPKALSWGEVRVIIRIPSAGIGWQDVGGIQLAGRPANVYQSHSFSLPANVTQALAGTASDLDVRFTVNVAAGQGVFLFDKLSFGGVSVPAPTSGTFKIVVPRGYAIDDTFMSTTERLTIDDRSTLGEVGKLANIASFGTPQSEFGAGVKAYTNVFSVANTNFLRSGSRIEGFLKTSGSIVSQNNVVIVGGVQTGVAIPKAETSWSVTWPATSLGNVSHPPDALNKNLVPGRYGSIQAYSRSTLSIRSGTYYVDSLRLEPQAHLRIDTTDGPVLFYVKNTLVLNAPLEYVAGPEGQLLFGYLGTTNANFEQALVASVVAPNATIDLRRPTTGLHKGSFFGKAVHVFSDATVRHRPFDFTFLCPSGDFDLDGVLDCNDECWDNKDKTVAGVCGCDKPETDSDGDKVPNCVDQCPNDAAHTYRGMCGCAGADAAPAGTFCNDGLVAGDFTCDGAGNCGDPLGGRPEPGCVPKTLGTHVYWICPGSGGGGGKTGDGAAALCAASPGRRLAQIGSEQENQLMARLVNTATWIGGTDKTTEGEWFWRGPSGADSVKFWTGGASGKRFDHRFEAWNGNAPVQDTNLDCATLSGDALWRAQNCSETRPYICEGTFGPGFCPECGHDKPEPLGPGDIVPGWYPDYDKGGDGTGGGGGDNGQDGCIPLPSSSDLADDADELDLCEANCGPDSTLSEAECAAYCEGAAAIPPAGSVCTPQGEPLADLDFVLPGTCEVLSLAEVGQAAFDAAQDCSGVSHPLFPGLPLRCGVKATCLHLDDVGGEMVSRDCETNADCNSGHSCDAKLRKCVDPNIANACQVDPTGGQFPAVDRKDADNSCYGQCFGDLGCGATAADIQKFFFPWLTPAPAPPLCDEVKYCLDEYTDEPDEAEFETNPPFDGTELADESDAPPPPYSNDFDEPCVGDACAGCPIVDPDTGTVTDAECGRLGRHSWCTNDAAAAGAPDTCSRDDRSGGRGDATTPVSFDVNPESYLCYEVKPLPLGLATFNLEAAGGVRAKVGFNVLGASGNVEVANLRAQVSASLCHARTTDSRMEILGIDFLPALAPDVLFNTDDLVAEDPEDPKFSEQCQAAVDGYIEALDRAKKALRDVQELLRQYEELKADGKTFTEDFCEEIIGNGPRPLGMLGHCPQTPEQLINDFINYYQYQATTKIRTALRELKQHVLTSEQLALAVQQLQEAAGYDPDSLDELAGRYGYSFFKGFDVSEKESVVLVSLTFFIGPIPALLEISNYLNYGLHGGFGLNLDPGTLVSGDGTFASVGGTFGAFANAGVTMFVGAGFNFGFASIAAGIEGGVSLGNVALDAHVGAGLAVHPEVEEPEGVRELPEDIQEVANGQWLSDLGRKPTLPFNSGFHLAYTYGVTFGVTDILSGHIDATLKISFLFFSKKFSTRLANFKSGFKVGPYDLINGGGSVPIAEGDKLWKVSYDTVPFPGIDKLQPPPAALQPVGVFDPSRAGELLYDCGCTCKAEDESCRRDDDCCDDGHTCNVQTDGSMTCGSLECADEWESCSEDDDCCDDGAVCVPGYNICYVPPAACLEVGENCVPAGEGETDPCCGALAYCNATTLTCYEEVIK